MTATQRKRLLKLADFIVEKVPAGRFDMGLFGAYANLNVNPHTCGTAGCALGWATVLFKKTGVVFEGGVPRYKRRGGYAVGVPLFGITYDESEQLFTGEKTGRSAKQVRRDILRLVARLDKETQSVAKYVSVGMGGPALEARAKRNGWNLFAYTSGKISEGWCGDYSGKKYFIKKP